MKRKRTFLVTIGVIFMLFAGTLLYAILRDDDPYRHFTGLGEKISVAPDDSKIAFSYYADGKESIYTANRDGNHAKKISDSKNRRDHAPKYSPDGKKLVYLSEDPEGIQTLRVINQDGSEERQLTDDKIHVADAIFSQNGQTIYFVAVEADEFKKGEESREGFDLFSIGSNGRKMRKLTDADHFSMNHLSLSPDGKTIYYSEFDGEKERLYSYSLEGGKGNAELSILPKEENAPSFYEPQLSPDGQHLAFTDVSKESQESSTFKYDLFLLDLETKNVERLTDLKKAVTSPAFFHKENKIAFLENTNWPKDPAVYRLKTIDITTHNIEAVKLDAPQSAGGPRFIQMLDRAVNSFTLAILYMLLMCLLSVYLHLHHPGRAYLPAIVSFSIAVITCIASFAVAATVDPWYGIGLGMLAAGIFGCSLIVILFVFIYKRLAK
ncbi:TolB family protein [Siminovitchia sp. 179-K 8D1 HS]|uniref:TolB family protein n=1 Tax=Siminovitchia sp. 179-K 8D1 HS TaxID=3142385 RepID=UPI0039A32E1E